MDKISEFWCKIRKIKHFKIVIALLLVALVCFVYAGYSQRIKSSKKNNVTTTEKQENDSTSLYSDTEKKLADTLSMIDGVGETKVYITSNEDGDAKSVIVLSENADKPIIEWRIRHAVQTALKVDYHNIEVFSMKMI